MSFVWSVDLVGGRKKGWRRRKSSSKVHLFSENSFIFTYRGTEINHTYEAIPKSTSLRKHQQAVSNMDSSKKLTLIYTWQNKNMTFGNLNV